MNAIERNHGGAKMSEIKLNIDLIAEIEELETKIAPSGAATLGDF